MQFGNYSVYISNDKGTLTEKNGYVLIRHNTQYKISLINEANTRCDALLMIDGKHVGTWRINKNSRIVLERPANDKRLFTFLKRDTQKGNDAGLGEVTQDDMGVVSVVFIPEKKREVYRSPFEVPQTYGDDYSKGVTRGGSRAGGASIRESFSAGGTGLSGESNQNFGIAENMELDHDAEVKISLRLICVEEKHEPTIKPLEDIRNLKQKETTVSLPIDKKLSKPEFFKLCRERFTLQTTQDLVYKLNQMKRDGLLDENNLTVVDIELVSEELSGGWM